MKGERALGSPGEIPECVGGITVGRAVLLSAKGKAEKVAAQDGEERGLVGVFFGLPGSEGLGGDVSVGEVENHGCQMPSSRGEIEVELGSGEVM